MTFSNKEFQVPFSESKTLFNYKEKSFCNEKFSFFLPDWPLEKSDEHILIN